MKESARTCLFTPAAKQRQASGSLQSTNSLTLSLTQPHPSGPQSPNQDTSPCFEPSSVLRRSPLSWHDVASNDCTTIYRLSAILIASTSGHRVSNQPIQHRSGCPGFVAVCCCGSIPAVLGRRCLQTAARYHACDSPLRSVSGLPIDYPANLSSFNGGSSNASAVQAGDGATGPSTAQMHQRDGVAMRCTPVQAARNDEPAP